MSRPVSPLLRRAAAVAAVLSLAAAGTASARDLRSGDQPYDDAPTPGACCSRPPTRTS